MVLLSPNITKTNNIKLLKQELIFKMKKFGVFPWEDGILIEVMDK